MCFTQVVTISSTLTPLDVMNMSMHVGGSKSLSQDTAAVSLTHSTLHYAWASCKLLQVRKCFSDAICASK